MTPSEQDAVEVSVVMPCLDEAETLAICIHREADALQRANIAGEIIVADNGSSDGSQEIARRAGARVVEVEAKGYGSALRGGIAAAQARFIIMADSDNRYDFPQKKREPSHNGQIFYLLWREGSFNTMIRE